MSRTVTLDLDGTLLPHTTAFAEVLRGTDREQDVADSDARFFAGDLSLHDCFVEQWAWVRERTLQDLHRALRKARWLPGISEGVARIKAAGLEVRMLTDQPSILTDFGARWGLGPAICSPTTVVEGRAAELDFREDKLANLRSAGLDPGDVIHVGNGANDVPVWDAGAHGIAVFAAPEVAAHAQENLGEPASFDPIAEAVLSAAGSTSPR